MKPGETIPEERTQPADRTPVHPHVALELECDRPLGGGLRLNLDGVDELSIGRGGDRTVVRTEKHGRSMIALRVPAPAMSALHARIVRDDKGWILRDDRSTNGTFVNGCAVRSRRLEAGDAIEMGHVHFLFLGQVVTPASTPRDLEVCPATGSRAIGIGPRTLSPTFYDELRKLERVAPTSLPVLVRGETGVGKELVARAVHERSARLGSLVTVNCAALPATLVEALLFGHCRGAFSGAVRDERGLVRASDGGTLFLDEIGDLQLGAQGALLRALQEGEVVPIGSTEPRRVDLRIVAATHRDLDLTIGLIL